MTSHANIDWDDEYANGKYIPDANSYIPKWAREAAEFRADMMRQNRADLNIAYGTTEREVFDLFRPEGPSKGLVTFVHGGYWKAFDKNSWSHLAAGALDHGYSVAIPSYTLAPTVLLSDITQQIGAAITAASDLIKGPIFLSGHSAGGHLVTRMNCASSPLSSAVSDRIENTVSISGIHDLRPLLKTTMQEELRLSPELADQESPVLELPLINTRITFWIGADERPQFVKQSEWMAAAWQGKASQSDFVLQAKKHHFDVINDLLDAGSELSIKLLS